MFDTGAKLVRTVGGPASFFEGYTTSNLYVERIFGANINTITVSNDSTTDTISLSYDGATLDGTLAAGESVTLNTIDLKSIYIRGAAGGGVVRIWGW
uniref:Uncharacterized protein n=1 Tax=viral metagenome TaxID=1070528 RepID=A0A6M3JCT6_9ZZZZ